jgi:hypothetical protein
MLLFAEHRKVSLKFVIRLMFEWPHKFGKDSYTKIQGKGTIKVKCTLLQALRLCTGRTAYRGSRGIPLLFHDHDTRRGWRVSVTPRPLFTPGKDPVPIIQPAGCDELITNPEESYTLWRVVVCDLGSSWTRRSWPSGGSCSPPPPQKKNVILLNSNVSFLLSLDMSRSSFMWDVYTVMNQSYVRIQFPLVFRLLSANSCKELSIVWVWSCSCPVIPPARNTWPETLK